MDVREKLIEILRKPIFPHELVDPTEAVADYLLDSGVTIQEWIPVSERLPERDGRYLCNYYFGEHRNMTFTSVLDYYATDPVPHFQHTLGDTMMQVTHWMPLPEPPKGE